MTTDTMTGEEFSSWMAAQHFNSETLARVLDVHPVTVRKWASEKYAIRPIVALALQFVASMRSAAVLRAAGKPDGLTFPEMSAEEFKAWMDEYAFSPDLLAQALDVHRVTVMKWRSGKHAIERVTYLALQRLAADRRALRERRKAKDAADRARTKARNDVATARERAERATLASA